MSSNWLVNPINERFWSKVDIRGSDECWNWTAATIRNGYGHFRLGNKLKLAHRIAWELINGPIPKGKLVLHICDNKKCVNPDHLYIGTYSDNATDTYQRHPQALTWQGRGLNPEERKEVTKLYQTKFFSQRKLAEMFGCCQKTISNELRIQELLERRL